ncbi:Retrovirus-related Pol polyprotein from transposon opus [Gossypium australe]|uniref:Retrovirus-related Pol polyprotein from transposon opus n=1 Tax=Gossypium australe TaxID=47621 RepID=A0A5B6VQ62_9ROSI|nr:Retrovirus-related Pol polyprotein from transposon opus [Gossypium australe]
MSRRRKIKTREQVKVSASCTAIISKQMPPKLKDPEKIGYIPICDLDTIINLIPLTIYETLGLRELKNTQITVQLVDRVLEDVWVKVRSFIILAGLIILDFKKDHEIPILLGRPFLATSRSTIDLKNNDLKMRLNGETKTFKCGHRQNKVNREKLGK